VLIQKWEILSSFIDKTLQSNSLLLSIVKQSYWKIIIFLQLSNKLGFLENTRFWAVWAITVGDCFA
jgi:hypothetical protein